MIGHIETRGGQQIHYMQEVTQDANGKRIKGGPQLCVEGFDHPQRERHIGFFKDIPGTRAREAFGDCDDCDENEGNG